MIDISTHASSRIDEDGHLEVTRTPVGDDASAAPSETLHPFGFIGRPHDSSVDADGIPTNGAHVAHWDEGSTEFAIPMHDARVSPPSLEKGGSAHYGAILGATTAGTWARINGTTGAYDVHVPSGQTVTVQVGSGAKIVISDATVKIGDDSAQALALGAALNQLIIGLRAFTTATKAAPVEPTLAPASTALDLVVQAIVQIQTTMTMGT